MTGAHSSSPSFSYYNAFMFLCSLTAIAAASAATNKSVANNAFPPQRVQAKHQPPIYRQDAAPFGVIPMANNWENGPRSRDGHPTKLQSKSSRGLLEEVEKVRVRFAYMFFADADFDTLAAPSQEVLQDLACQTDSFLTSMLQDRLQTTLRVSLEVLDWTYDPTREHPLELFFQVEAFYDDPFLFDKHIKAVEVVRGIDTADFGDYVSNYVWQTYPLQGTPAKVIRNINRLSYDAQTFFVPTEVPTANVLYNTLTCRASSKVNAVWYFGFFEGTFTGPESSPQPAQEDMQAVSCQIRSFLEAFLSEKNYGAPATVELQRLEWQYTADSPEYQVDAKLDMRATIQHANGEVTLISSQTLSNMAKEADLVAFILEYVHTTQTETQVTSGTESVFLSVQRVTVDSIIMDVAPTETPTGNAASIEWTSAQCPINEATATPMETPTPTLMPSLTTTAIVVDPTQATPGSTGQSEAVANTLPTATPANGLTPQNTASGVLPPSDFLGWCRTAMFAVDGDQNQRLSRQEYIDLLNTVGEQVFEGYPFPALPTAIQNAFDDWTSSSSGQIDLQAQLMPSENSQGIDTSTMSSFDLQEFRRDSICNVTEAALLATAADAERPEAVRLGINTTFLATNQVGMNSTDDFWENSTNLQSAFANFVESHVPNAMVAILKQATEDQGTQLRGRRQLQTDLPSDNYWVLPETTDLWQVQGTRCPLESPENTSCLLATTSYEIFVLTHNISDSLNTDAIVAAAYNVTEDGIANGELQKSLELINPSTVWTLHTDPTSNETVAPTPAPTARLSTLVPTIPASVIVPATTDEQVSNTSTGEFGNATRVFSKNQCGGDLGLKALEFMKTDCDSFAGRHVWTIFALSFLFIVLLCLFAPVLVCGGYPCCPGKRADKISSGATRCTVSVDPTGDNKQPRRGGRRPKVGRQNSGLSSLSSGVGSMLDRRSKLRRQGSARSGISSISSGFSGFGGKKRQPRRGGRRPDIQRQNSGLSELSDDFDDDAAERGNASVSSGFSGFGRKKRKPRRGRRPDMNRQNSGLSALSDDFDDEAIERRNAKSKAGRENIVEPGEHAEPWFYGNSGAPKSSAHSYDSGVSVDIHSTDGYVGPSAPPRRGIQRTNSYDSAYSGVSGERMSLY